MEIHSLPELIQWALLKTNAINKTTAETVTAASNLVLFLYFVTYLLNRKACFITAFFIVEFIGVISYTQNHYLYISYALTYSFTYWYLFINNYKLKIMSGYVIMLLFQLVMTADAYYYPRTKTALYNCYEYIFVAIHIYIVSTIVDRRTLIKTLGNCVGGVLAVLNIGYGLSFCYYSLKFNQSKRRRCH